jgi:hypothetical protein
MGGNHQMMKYLVPVMVIPLLVSTSFIGVSFTIEKTSTASYESNTLYVGGSGPGNYTKIQDAINDASNRDTVFVYDDSSPYNEHITITKSLVITGENKHTTKILGKNEDKDIVFIQSDETTLCNFTIRYGSMHHSGILITYENTSMS